MSLARRVEIDLTWNAVDITRDITPALLGLTRTDHLSGAADDLTIELEDRGALWAGDWRPEFGHTVEGRVRAEAWFSDVTEADLGLYSHDNAAFGGPPRRVTLRAISAGLATGLRRHRRAKAWTGVTLRRIADDIVTAAGLTLDWQVDGAGLTYRRREQKDQSDLEFLEKEAAEQGLALKIINGTVVIFDERDRERTDPVGSIALAGDHVLSWSFDDGKSDHYGRCRVRCFDPRTGKHVEAYYRTPDDDGPTLEARRAVGTKGEAEWHARALLRQANSFANKGRLAVVGDLGLVAGVVFTLEGANAFSGKFIITKASHRFVGGYACDLEIRRCIEGY